MNVAIPSELLAFIESKVTSGEYGSTEDVVVEALSLLRRVSQTNDDTLAALRHDVQIGIDQMERGEFIECDDESLRELFEDIKRRGRERLAQRKASAG